MFGIAYEYAALRARVFFHQPLPRVEKHNWKMWMKIDSVYDGDTVVVLCLFHRKLVKWRCRLMHFDAPELRTKNSDEKEAAIRAREFLKTLLPTGFVYQTCHGLDKYGRLLIDFRCVKSKLKVSDVMIQNGHGYAYDGGQKQPFSK